MARSLLQLLPYAVSSALLLSPAQLAAQRFFGLGGLEVRAGAAFPEDAKAGPSASLDVDLGYLRTPTIRTILGLNYFSADVDRQANGAAVDGSFTGTGGRVGVRLDPLRSARFSPYLTTMLTGHSISADVSDPGTENLLDGFYIGASAGAGVAFGLDSARRMWATVDARRVFIANAGHTAIEVGIRWLPRGEHTWARIPSARDAESRLLAERAAEAERLSREAERARADELARIRGEREANRLATEREREVEQDRLRREEAARQADAERLRREDADRQAEAERRRLDQAAGDERRRTEVESLRRQADSAEVARRTEATARAAAEADAAAARERAAELEAAAKAAEARATEAERLRYEALLDLDRLIADVAEIRETERGLAIVLGQGLFGSGQSDLSARARAQVGPIAAVLGQYRERRIAVEGHTDAVGSELANQRLSERRAESVRAALIAEGVDPSRIDMSGYGQSRPIADNGTAEGRARNRRVEIVIIGATRPAR